MDFFEKVSISLRILLIEILSYEFLYDGCMDGASNAHNKMSHTCKCM